MTTPGRKAIPDSARFNYVTGRAYALLLELGIDHFPISPWGIIDQSPERIICLSWTEASSVLKSDDPFHLHQQGAEARTIKQRGSSTYMIVYDDFHVTNRERISWSIMHELGHIFLGHLDSFDATALDRGGLSDAQYGVLEIEAHYFASEVFAPTAVLKHLTDVKVEDIRLLCGISTEAAEKKHRRVYARTYHPVTQYDEKLLRNFAHSLYWELEDMLYQGIRRIWGTPNYRKYIPICRKCPICLSFVTLPEAKHCIYCGCSLDAPYIVRKRAEQLVGMPGRVHKAFPSAYLPQGDYPPLMYCPVCLNHEFSEGARFCRVCGHPLYNTCTREKTLVPQAAHYCPDCGSEAAFRRGYMLAEQRYELLDRCNRLEGFREDWIEYPYWDFIRSMAGGLEHVEIASALRFSKAYVNDDEDLVVFVISQRVAQVVLKESGRLLEIANRNDSVPHKRMEVYCVNVL